jgi:uroporphyrinogen-III synthase
MRVIVTRPAAQAGQWVKALRAAGLDALSLPLIEITGPPEPQAVLAAWQRIHDFDALMFVSANAVEQFFALQPAACAAWQTTGPSRPRCFVTGPGSRAALLQAGVAASRIDAPDPIAAQFDSEALWRVVGAQVQAGWRVLIVRGDSQSPGDMEGADQAEPGQGVGRDWLAARLIEQGATVEFLVGYARRAPHLSANALALLQVASADGTVWLFSSSEAVANLRSLTHAAFWQQARAVATHARIAQAVRAAGFAEVCESRPVLTELIASIESLA